MLRRSFLKAFAAAPVAAPVLAREAAAKAGVGPLLNANTLQGSPLADPVPPPNGSFIDYVREEVQRTMSSEWTDRIRSESVRNVKRLDPDLACSRSLSLSAAVRLQAERDADRRIAEARNHWLSEFRKTTGTEWLA
jgi:hypothetical protein